VINDKNFDKVVECVSDEIGKLNFQQGIVEQSIKTLHNHAKKFHTSQLSFYENVKQKIQIEINLLYEEKDLIENSLSRPPVSLNVGGVIYYTTLSTLIKEKDSMLSSMFSGRHNLVKDENGHYFLDRDGQLFRYILNYLRTSKIPDLSDNELNDLRVEAEYFSILSLINLIDEKLEGNGKYAVLRHNETSNYNNLSWQGMTKPCSVTTENGLYKCIDEVLSEVDNRGWRLTHVSGDGNFEGGWMFTFRKEREDNLYDTEE